MNTNVFVPKKIDCFLWVVLFLQFEWLHNFNFSSVKQANIRFSCIYSP